MRGRAMSEEGSRRMAVIRTGVRHLAARVGVDVGDKRSVGDLMQTAVYEQVDCDAVLARVETLLKAQAKGRGKK